MLKIVDNFIFYCSVEYSIQFEKIEQDSDFTRALEAKTGKAAKVVEGTGVLCHSKLLELLIDFIDKLEHDT